MESKQKWFSIQADSNGGSYCSALLLMQFWQLHVQHMPIMTLQHDIIMSSIVSMPHIYFRMEFMSYGCFQLDIKLLQYIFTSMYQINIHQGI